jgi:hypothetical protein
MFCSQDSTSRNATLGCIGYGRSAAVPMTHLGDFDVVLSVDSGPSATDMETFRAFSFQIRDAVSTAGKGSIK